ncbi:PREDICTED: uncharacterized protein LOC108966154 [Bactrocera latifrons]|uniref:Uncharacterized protein n=2 Tax=Bactrocera latifrons TaxID=174628 RepID=A0A0K8UIF5_BACLA|nr:PREDICTED: uncharacterized protein LOC108966154 [Bactrocera latifrons]
MLLQLQRNSYTLRAMLFITITLLSLLSPTKVAGGSIPSTHKNPAQQQQIAAQQQVHMQQQHPLQHQQQQQQVAEIHHNMNQQNTNAQLRSHEQPEQMLSTLSQLSTITTSGSNNPVNHEYSMKDVGVDEELNEPYQYLTDLKVEPRLTTGNSLPWNPYVTTNSPFTHMPGMLTNLPYNPYGAIGGGGALPPLVTPRLMPFFSYPQPVFIPFPMYFAPTELLYSGYAGPSGNEIEEPMPRAANDHRAQSAHFDTAPPTGSSAATARNSQIYFMRFAPMPYMLMPGLSFASAQSNLPAFQPYTVPAISPVLNIPLNFVANGKPTNIYQIGGTPNDFQSSANFNNINPFGMRPPSPLSSAFAFVGTHRPTAANIASSYSTNDAFGPSTSPQSALQALQQDSKMTLLKRPFLFNGRPDEIYTLPNNFNSLYPNSAYY